MSNERSNAEHLRLVAMMDQMRAKIADADRKIEVTDVELFALVNLARYGMLHAYAMLSPPGMGEKAAAESHAQLFRIVELDGDGAGKGIPSMIVMLASMLQGERMGNFVIQPPQAEASS